MSFLFSCQWSLDSRFPNRFFASRTSWIPDCTKQKHSGVPESGFPYLVKREKKSLILPAISAGPRNYSATGIAHRHGRCTGDRWRGTGDLAGFLCTVQLRLTNSDGFSSRNNSGVLFCWQALCCTSHTAAAAVLREVKTFMSGASISPIVRLHCAPLENHNAAGLFRFCVATMLALLEFRSLLSGCIYNM